jgi:hypothetical protein
MLCLLKTSRTFQMFAAVTHLAEGLSLETFLTLTCLVSTRRLRVPIILVERQSILFSKMLKETKRQDFVA